MCSRNNIHLINILRWKQIKIRDDRETIYVFWLNYCNENHIEKIPVAVKDIDDLFNLTSEMIGADNLHLFLLPGCTQIDKNEYLSSLENDTELIVCREEQLQKLLIKGIEKAFNP